MIAKAKGSYIRVSEKKANQYVRILRDKPVNEALSTLRVVNKRSRQFILKILNSAISNAKNKGFNTEQLYISKIIVEKGPMWKRFRAAAFGRANEILKRTSHIKIELDVLSKQ